MVLATLVSFIFSSLIYFAKLPIFTSLAEKNKRNFYHWNIVLQSKVMVCLKTTSFWKWVWKKSWQCCSPVHRHTHLYRREGTLMTALHFLYNFSRLKLGLGRIPVSSIWAIYVEIYFCEDTWRYRQKASSNEYTENRWKEPKSFLLNFHTRFFFGEQCGHPWLCNFQYLK